MKTPLTSLLFCSVFISTAYSADLITGPYKITKSPDPLYESYFGRVAVKNGHTLYYPVKGKTVKLMDVDTCDVPQWAVDVDNFNPVPCGALSKAWMKRLIGNNDVFCEVATINRKNQEYAYCFIDDVDLGMNLVSRGWGYVTTPNVQNSRYLRLQKHAMEKRYGMWNSLVMDMSEWRRRAKNKTVSRKPIADYFLLLKRKKEISPAFKILKEQK